MPIEIDYNAQLLKITSPTTEVDLQTLHDFVEDERGLAQPTGLSRIAPPSTSPTGDPIFVVEGKIEDPASPGNYSQILLVLISPWQIQFWQGSGYTRVYGGKLSGGLGDEPVKATGAAGDLTVLQSQLDGTYTLVETGTSGLTGAESQAILDLQTDSAANAAALALIQTAVTNIETDVATIETDIGTIQIDLAVATKIMRNKKITDEVTGILTVYEDNSVDVWFQANLYESKDTSQAYRGRGMQRQERLETP